MATEADREAIRAHRSLIRAAVEDAATTQDVPGICTAFVVFAEIASLEEGEPCRTIFIDSSDASDWGLTPWTLRSIVDYGMESIDQQRTCAECQAQGEDDDD